MHAQRDSLSNGYLRSGGVDQPDSWTCISPRTLGYVQGSSSRAWCLWLFSSPKTASKGEIVIGREWFKHLGWMRLVKLAPMKAQPACGILPWHCSMPWPVGDVISVIMLWHFIDVPHCCQALSLQVKSGPCCPRSCLFLGTISKVWSYKSKDRLTRVGCTASNWHHITGTG